MLQDAVLNRITQLCEKRGVSVYNLGNTAGVSHSTIFQMFQSKDIKLSTIKKLCDALEITLGDFFNDPIFSSLPPEVQ